MCDGTMEVCWSMGPGMGPGVVSALLVELVADSTTQSRCDAISLRILRDILNSAKAADTFHDLVVALSLTLPHAGNPSRCGSLLLNILNHFCGTEDDVRIRGLAEWLVEDLRKSPWYDSNQSLERTLLGLNITSHGEKGHHVQPELGPIGPYTLLTACLSWLVGISADKYPVASTEAVQFILGASPGIVSDVSVQGGPNEACRVILIVYRHAYPDICEPFLRKLYSCSNHGAQGFKFFDSLQISPLASRLCFQAVSTEMARDLSFWLGENNSLDHKRISMLENLWNAEAAALFEDYGTRPSTFEVIDSLHDMKSFLMVADVCDIGIRVLIGVHVYAAAISAGFISDLPQDQAEWTNAIVSVLDCAAGAVFCRQSAVALFRAAKLKLGGQWLEAATRCVSPRSETPKWIAGV